MKIFKYSFLSLFSLLFVFGFSYWYPRFLVSQLGEDSIWISYLYTYGTGLIFFLLSVFWIFTRKKEAGRKAEEIKWLIIVCCGLTLMFLFHGLWIFIAGQVPVQT